MLGCSVFTLPSIISGKLVTSSTGTTLTPASLIDLEVPPVEISSMPILSSPLANSDIPDLSLTLINTREIERRSKFLSFDTD